MAIFDYHKPEPTSILKMMQDIFSQKETSNIFFTNDLMVLIDIILRQFTDRCPGDKVSQTKLDFKHLLKGYRESFWHVTLETRYNLFWI